MCQNFRSLALTVWMLCWFEDISTKDELVNESFNDGCDCRTAPATQGLLISRYNQNVFSSFLYLGYHIGYRMLLTLGACPCSRVVKKGLQHAQIWSLCLVSGTNSGTLKGVV